MARAVTVLACMFSLLCACRDKPKPTAFAFDSTEKPLVAPTSVLQAPSEEHPNTDTAVQQPDIFLVANEGLSRSARLETPGALRSRALLPGIASSLQPATSERGVLVSIGSSLLLMSLEATRGHWAAGASHQVLALDGIDIVYAPAFKELFELLPRGRRGWSRQVAQGHVMVSENGVYILDASTLRKISSDGKDEWQAVIQGARQLEGPFPCDTGVVVQGRRGSVGEAVRLGVHGDIGRRLELKSGALLLAVTRSCDPVVWSEGRLLQLDERGQTTWGRATNHMPLCTTLPAGLACIASRGESSALFELICATGKTLAASELPMTGRLTAAKVASSPKGLARVIAACTDVTSPCARRDTNRGPFNALMGVSDDGTVTPLFQHPTGHIGFEVLPDGRLVTASSIDGEATSVTTRDASNRVLWLANLPGRLSAGPTVASNTVYVATCKGLACEPPYELFGLTLERPDPSQDPGATKP